jgi:hypothetical protein
VSTNVEERQRIASIDDGDHERLAHIVWTPGRNAAAVLTEARIYGHPVTALCGKRWVPSRDPARFPICPDCKAAREVR